MNERHREAIILREAGGPGVVAAALREYALVSGALPGEFCVALRSRSFNDGTGWGFLAAFIE